MKKNALLTILILLSMKALSQEHIISIGGGYTIANIEDTDINGKGSSIKCLYEYNPMGGRLAHGFALGYTEISATEGIQTNNVNSFPIYYAPKIIYGRDRLRGFIKGAIGLQIASIKRRGLVSLDDTDYGFYGGAGAGVMFFVKENVFFNAEYELSWVSNSWYRDGWISTIGGGVGFRF